MSRLHRARIARHRAAIARAEAYEYEDGTRVVRVTMRSGAGRPGGTFYVARPRYLMTVTLPITPMRGQVVILTDGLTLLHRRRTPWLNFLQRRQA